MIDDRDTPAAGDGMPDGTRMEAAEYALGVLDAFARDAARRRMERDPAFARAVDDWNARLAPMLDEVEPVAPPPAVWRAIEGTVGRADAAPSRPVASVRDAAAPLVRAAIPLWRALGLMGVGAAAAAALLFVSVDRGLVDLSPDAAPAPALAPALVATLTPDGAAPPALARLDPSGTLTVRIVLAENTDRVPELWLVPGDGVPRSLGLLADGGGTIALPAGIVPASGEALAVSLEPPGGSPTGAPTGPVIASGQLVSL